MSAVFYKEEQIGTKAASLLYLSKLNLSPSPLLILDQIPPENGFVNLLKEAGFNDEQKIGVRFSYAGLMELPRSKGLAGFDKIYAFVQKYSRSNAVTIIHPFVDASFVGTFHFETNGSFLFNLVKSEIWEPSVTNNCDIFLINDKKKVLRYKKARFIYIPTDEVIKKEKIEPLTQEEIEYLVGIFEKYKIRLKNLRKLKDLITEFIITPSGKMVCMEMESISRGVDYSAIVEDNFFPIKSYDDIKKWDKKSDLLLTLTVYRKDKDKFLKLIDEIKKYKSEVYVEYGLLSHPAILLREVGLATKPYLKDYEEIIIK